MSNQIAIAKNPGIKYQMEGVQDDVISEAKINLFINQVSWNLYETVSKLL